MLDLKPCVDLHEVVVAGGRLHQELDSASVGVADTLAEVHSVTQDGASDLSTGWTIRASSKMPSR